MLSQFLLCVHQSVFGDSAVSEDEMVSVEDLRRTARTSLAGSVEEPAMARRLATSSVAPSQQHDDPGEELQSVIPHTAHRWGVAYLLLCA